MTSIGGCDSIIFLSLSVTEQNIETESIKICDGQEYKGYTLSGNYQYEDSDAEGCPSFINLNLEVLPIAYTDTVSQNIIICEDNNVDKLSDGIYYNAIVSGDRCIIEASNVQIGNVVINQRKDTICEEDNYNNWTLPGTYLETLTTTNGCDSIIELELFVRPITYTKEEITICDGDSYRGHSEAGEYIDTIQSEFGCNVIVDLTLTLDDKLVTNQRINICEDESDTLPYEISGVYIDTLSTVTGCDSLIVKNVRVGSCQNLCSTRQFIEQAENYAFVHYKGTLLNDHLAYFELKYYNAWVLNGAPEFLIYRHYYKYDDGLWTRIDDGRNARFKDSYLTYGYTSGMSIRTITEDGQLGPIMTIPIPNDESNALTSTKYIAITTDAGTYVSDMNISNINFFQLDNYTDVQHLEISENRLLIKRYNDPLVLPHFIVYTETSTGWVSDKILTQYVVTNFGYDFYFDNNSVITISDQYVHKFTLENGSWIEEIIPLELEDETIESCQIEANNISCQTDSSQHLLILEHDRITYNKVNGISNISENYTLSISIENSGYINDIYAIMTPIDKQYNDYDGDGFGEREYLSTDTISIDICPGESYEGYSTTGEYILPSNFLCEQSTLLLLNVLEESDPLCITSYTEEVGESNLTISPNPTNSIINIQLTNASKNNRISIHDTNGRQVENYIMTDDNKEIDISHLSEGIYIIEVYNDKSRYVEAVIKL